MPNINDLLQGHVTLEVECLDRLYLNGWVPRLASGGGLRLFLSEHLDKPVPSPALLGQITQRFVKQLHDYCEQQQIPRVRFQRGERKDERAHGMRRQRPVRDAVVFVGVAQEKALAYSARKRGGDFEFSRDKTV